MSLEIEIHSAQIGLLHVLLMNPSATFAKLQKESGLTSDHFTFHLKRLTEQELIRKREDGHYVLTARGKEYANRMDTDTKELERQAKSAVVLLIEDDQGRAVAQQRLKQPFYGWWGRPTGKIRWGETVLEAAARELMEETGLTATLRMCGIYHKMDYNKGTGALLEDKFFYVMHGVNPKGKLVEDFDGGKNAWLSMDELLAKEDRFDGIPDISAIAHGKQFGFMEREHRYAEDQY